MQRRITLIQSILAVLLFLFCACSTQQKQLLFQKPIDASIAKSQADVFNNGNGTSDYKIKSQDLLQIRNLQNIKYIVDETPTSNTTNAGSSVASQGQTFQVDDDGTVALPVIGRIPVAGLTRAEAAKTIEDIYRTKVLKDPIIDLRIVNLKVTILGEIRTQGNFPLTKDKTSLVEMIGEAGGLTEKANEKNIKIIRGDPKNPQVTEVDLGSVKTLADPRLILQNNDIIYIAQNKRAVRSDQIQNFSNTLSPGLIILNTALIIYTLVHR